MSTDKYLICAGRGAPDPKGGPAGDLYIADFGNCRVRRVSGSTITTLAGTGGCGFSGDGGAATSADLGHPSSVAVDAAGNLYIADYFNCRVRKVTRGVISSVSGTGTCTYSGDTGPATSASVSGPFGVAVDATGNLFFGDAGNNRIRKITPNGIITTVAGNGQIGFSGDGGPATSASLAEPRSISRSI